MKIPWRHYCGLQSFGYYRLLPSWTQVKEFTEITQVRIMYPHNNLYLIENRSLILALLYGINCSLSNTFSMFQITTLTFMTCVQIQTRHMWLRVNALMKSFSLPATSPKFNKSKVLTIPKWGSVAMNMNMFSKITAR